MRAPSIDLFAEPRHRRSPAIARVLWPLTLTLALIFKGLHAATLSTGSALGAVWRHFFSGWFFLHAAIWAIWSVVHITALQSYGLQNWWGSYYKHVYHRTFNIDYAVIHQIDRLGFHALYPAWSEWCRSYLIIPYADHEFAFAHTYMMAHIPIAFALVIFVVTFLRHLPRTFDRVIG